MGSDEEVNKILLKQRSDLENANREIEKYKKENEELKKAPKPPILMAPPQKH
jgi:hypothetical protein